MKRIKTKEPIPLATCDNPYVLALKGMTESYSFYGTITLGSNFSVTASGTPKANMTCWLWFNSAITPGAFTFNILGTQVNARTLASPFVAVAKYDVQTATWMVIYGNFILGKPIDGTTLKETSNVLSVYIIGNTHFSSESGERLVYAKMNLLGQLLNTDLHTDFAMPVNQLAPMGTHSVIAIYDSDGFLTFADTSTYPTLAELAFVKGLSSAVQDQLDAIVTDFSNYYTSTEVDAILGSYYTSAQVDAAITAALAGLAPIKDLATLTTSTDLSGVGTLYQEYMLDATSAAVDIILPLANSVAPNTPLRLTLYGTANASDVTRKGTDDIIDTNKGTLTSVTLTAIGDFVQLVSDGSSKWKIIDKKIT